MKKYALIPLIVLVALFAGAGKYKISKVGQPDVYVPTLDSDAKTLTVENITGPGSVPIGGMVAVMPNIDASNAWQPPSSGVIKDGFMRADGVTIAASHRNAGCKLAVGTKLPNMVNSYPRGNTTSTDGTTGTGGANTQAGSTTVAQQPTFSTPAHYHSKGSGSTAATTVGVTGGTCSGTFASSSHYHPGNVARGGDTVVRFVAYGIDVASDMSYTMSTGDEAGHRILAGSWPSGGVTTEVARTGGNSASASVSSTAATPTGSNAVAGFYGLYTGGADGNTAIVNSRTAAVTLTDNAVNNEPAYVETVWVIRVK